MALQRGWGKISSGRKGQVSNSKFHDEGALLVSGHARLTAHRPHHKEVTARNCRGKAAKSTERDATLSRRLADKATGSKGRAAVAVAKREQAVNNCSLDRCVVLPSSEKDDDS